jgi:hypothetical protein
MSEIERLGPSHGIPSRGRFHRWWVLVVLLSVLLGPCSASAYSDVTMQGTISQLWNATATGTRGAVHFTGVDWNRALAPGASAQFGFCATR